MCSWCSLLPAQELFPGWAPQYTCSPWKLEMTNRCCTINQKQPVCASFNKSRIQVQSFLCSSGWKWYPWGLVHQWTLVHLGPFGYSLHKGSLWKPVSSGAWLIRSFWSWQILCLSTWCILLAQHVDWSGKFLCSFIQWLPKEQVKNNKTPWTTPPISNPWWMWWQCHPWFHWPSPPWLQIWLHSADDRLFRVQYSHHPNMLWLNCRGHCLPGIWPLVLQKWSTARLGLQQGQTLHVTAMENTCKTHWCSTQDVVLSSTDGQH